MDTQEKILAQIKKYNRIVIHRHQRPDPDAIGSQVGLAKICKHPFPTNKSRSWENRLMGKLARANGRR